MGPLEKGKHVGKWGVTMESAKSYELDVSEGDPLFVNVDGEAVLTTPVSMEYADNQLTVRGAATIPNE
jgi:diacylglycerol kinase family enzyme